MLLLQNGFLFDGTGTAPVQGDVLIDGDRILEVGSSPFPADCARLDCSGLAIAPGFIDLHSHADLQVLENRMEKVKQGVTTEVVGNCGFSPFPQSGDPRTLHEFGDGILGTGDWGWPTARGYLDAIEKSATVLHVAPLIGHGSLRIAVVGPRQGPLSGGELDRMAGMLEEALDAGCPGFSTGLMYAPGSSAGADELERLIGVVARKGKLYATHMRSYSSGLVDAVREQLDLTRATGCRLQISHLQAAGRANWNRQQTALDEIEAGRKQGLDVEFDIYPYQCGSTVLTQWLPQWALDGGTEALMQRLRDRETRTRLTQEMERLRAQLWSDVTVSAVATEENQDLVGTTIAQIAERRKGDPSETVLNLLLEEHAAVNVISFNQSEENLRDLIAHPLCSIISDGFYVKGKAHPRLYGTFPELLGTVVRDKGWLSLSEAIHKITAKPAARLNLQGRGMLRNGYFADVTVFDPGRVASRSTYEAPAADPLGIGKVFKDGQQVYDGGDCSTV
ncbi:MAG: D-aminoacylase [Acidobacteriota bacterium]|nr:D-aminoacylase [Acidobacteriota bacterium]